jgi:hypothetical protein
MATVATHPARQANMVSSLPGRRYDHIFFSGMALLLLITVVVGFAPTYYLAGIFRAPLPSPIIHVHGALFSCWILLLLIQTSLVSAGRVDIHRRLGIAGFVLACTMVVVGLLAATNALVRNFPPGRDPLAFFIIPVTDMIVFPVLIAFAFRARSNPAVHKRIILVATIALMTAPLARWPIALIHRKPPMAQLASYTFLLLIIAYDLWSYHKPRRATVWAGAFLVFMQQISGPISKTAAWHAFAGWVQSIAR